MYKKVIIIYNREFTNKEYLKNSIKDFLKKKILLEIWIVSKILDNSKNVDKKKIFFNEKIKLKVLNKYTELENELLNENKYSLFDIRIKLNLKNLNFFKIFFKYNFDYIIFPGLILEKNKLHYNIILSLQNFLIWLNFFVKKIKIKKAKFIYIIAKKADLTYNMLVGRKSIRIQGHHADFDKYLKIKNNFKKKKLKYFLFIDQNVPYHDDLKEMEKNDIDAKKYYQSIMNFLEDTKKKFNIDFLVSPHPRANKKNLEKFFKDKLLNKDTHVGVQNCEFVICHDSTAANFAILFNKPIISIFNNQMINSKYNHIDKIKSFSERVKAPMINIDNDGLDISSIRISSENNANYIKNYISSHKENKLRIDILMKKINFNE